VKEIIKLAQTIPVPDGAFYYTVTVLLFSALIYVVNRYTSSVNDTLKVLTGKVQALEVNDGKQDEKIKALQDEKTIVKYRDEKKRNW
jgi:hypothetical protein